MILTDANIQVALVDVNQPLHARCMASLLVVAFPLVTTWPAFTEANYLLSKLGGWPLQRKLWQFIEKGTLQFHVSTFAEQLRMIQLMEQYRDRPMDLADASLVAAAEALNVTRIFTFDSDFYFYRINDKGVFEVVP